MQSRETHPESSPHDLRCDLARRDRRHREQVYTESCAAFDGCLLNASAARRLAGLTRPELLALCERGAFPPPQRRGSKTLWLAPEIQAWRAAFESGADTECLRTLVSRLERQRVA